MQVSRCRPATIPKALASIRSATVRMFTKPQPQKAVRAHWTIPQAEAVIRQPDRCDYGIPAGRQGPGTSLYRLRGRGSRGPGCQTRSQATDSHSRGWRVRPVPRRSGPKQCQALPALASRSGPGRMDPAPGSTGERVVEPLGEREAYSGTLKTGAGRRRYLPNHRGRHSTYGIPRRFQAVSKVPGP